MEDVSNTLHNYKCTTRRSSLARGRSKFSQKASRWSLWKFFARLCLLAEKTSASLCISVLMMHSGTKLTKYYSRTYRYSRGSMLRQNTHLRTCILCTQPQQCNQGSESVRKWITPVSVTSSCLQLLDWAGIGLEPQPQITMEIYDEKKSKLPR